MTAARLIASGFGAGYAPKAPGTFGSLLGLGLGAALLRVGRLPLAAGAACATAAGVWAVQKSGDAARDPGWIVVDEVAGQMTAMLGLKTASAPGLVLALAAFRLFDITKWGPVGWADARHDAAGVMADDIVAGAAAAGVLLLIRQAVRL